MGKIFLLIFILVGVILLLSNRDVDNTNNVPLPSSVEDQVDYENIVSVNLNDQDYEIAWYEVDDIKGLSLHNNLNDQEKSIDIFEKNNCTMLINAGFYSEDGKPIGLFVINGEKLSDYQRNYLFNGFLQFDESTVEISDKSDGMWENVLQTGPLLYFGGNPISLSLKTDKPARRVLGISDFNNRLYFAIVYQKNNFFNGPHLADLPQIIKEFSDKSGIATSNAINLDGGSASAFVVKSFRLTEAAPIGSYFCHSEF